MKERNEGRNFHFFYPFLLQLLFFLHFPHFLPPIIFFLHSLPFLHLLHFLHLLLSPVTSHHCLNSLPFFTLLLSCRALLACSRRCWPLIIWQNKKIPTKKFHNISSRRVTTDAVLLVFKCNQDRPLRPKSPAQTVRTKRELFRASKKKENARNRGGL